MIVVATGVFMSKPTRAGWVKCIHKGQRHLSVAPGVPFRLSTAGMVYITSSL